MPSRRSRRVADNEREERKRRQEKFRKRTRSLFNKTRLLARDTDAWVALFVRDRAGRVQSFRSSGRRHWPPSIQDLMAAHPSDTHEFLEKQAISGSWRAVAEDESDTDLVDGDAESVDEGVPVMSVTPILAPVEGEAEPDSTISVGEEVEEGANALTDEPSENVVEEVESTTTPLYQGPDETLIDPKILLEATTNAAAGSGSPKVSSPVNENAAISSNLSGYTIPELGEPDNMTVDVVEESNNITTEMAVDSHDTIANAFGDSDSVPDVPGGVKTPDMLGTTDPDPTPLVYDDMMDLDMDDSKVRCKALPEVSQGDSSEVANALHTMSEYQNPPGDGGLGGWQVLNRPKMDPRELLQGWTWVFQK